MIRRHLNYSFVKWLLVVGLLSTVLILSACKLGTTPPVTTTQTVTATQTITVTPPLVTTIPTLTPTPTPTPLALPPPTFSLEEGVFGTYQIVTIQVEIQDVQIFYTLTGSEPNTASTTYTGPIEVRTSRTIKAIAVKEGWNNSPVASVTYIIDYGDLPLGEIGGLQYVSWDFGIERFKDYYIDITIHNEPDNHDGLYFQMYQGEINGVGFYFGLQTDVYRPGAGSTGKGLIFSRWGTRDTSNVRIVEGGWSQSAGSEGDFVGIRKNYDWTTHKYQFRLNLIESDSVGDWYGVWIYDYDIGFEDYLGSIRFPAAEPGNAGIWNNGITWTELYYKAEIPTPIPDWHVSVDGVFATIDRIPPQHASVWYSTDVLTNTDVYWDSDNNEIHFLMGPGVTREHQLGQVY